MGRELAEVVDWLVIGQSPVEGELPTAIGIIGKIASVDAVGDDKELDVVEQAAEGSLLVALHLVVGLLKLYAAFLEFNLYERETVDEDGDVVAAGLAAFHGNLVGYLEFILTPVVFVQELHPDTVLAVLGFHREEVAEFLGLLEEGSALQIDADLLEFLIGKCRATYLGQLFGIMFFQLRFEVAVKVGFFLDLDILIAHVLQGRNQSILKRLFALCRHFA